MRALERWTRSACVDYLISYFLDEYSNEDLYLDSILTPNVDIYYGELRAKIAFILNVRMVVLNEWIEQTTLKVHLVGGDMSDEDKRVQWWCSLLRGALDLWVEKQKDPVLNQILRSRSDDGAVELSDELCFDFIWSLKVSKPWVGVNDNLPAEFDLKKELRTWMPRIARELVSTLPEPS